MNDAVAQGPELIHETTRHLPCKLTDDEALRAGDELAQVIEDMSTEESRAQEVRAQLKASMTVLESRRSMLASKVRRREEYRDVTVLHLLRHDGMVDIVREDTMAVLETRVASEDELQRDLIEDAGDEDE